MTNSFYRYANEEIVTEAISFAQKNKKQFCYTIDGESFIKNEKEQVLGCLKFADVVFCDKFVAMAFMEHMKGQLGMQKEAT